MTTTITATYGVKFDKSIVKAAFPEYRGRKITSKIGELVNVTGTYWDGGSRNEFVAVELATMRVQPMAAALRDPVELGGMRGGKVAVPVGYAIVEHSIFCGRDVGCVVYYAAAVAGVREANEAESVQLAANTESGR